MKVQSAASSSHNSTFTRRIRQLLVVGWLVTEGSGYVLARQEGWRGLTSGPRPWVFVVVGAPWLVVYATAEAVFEARQRKADRAAAPTRSPFAVLRPDRSVDAWGQQGDARYELDGSGRLRVLLCTDNRDGATDREVRVYQSSEWLEVRQSQQWAGPNRVSVEP